MRRIFTALTFVFTLCLSIPILATADEVVENPLKLEELTIQILPEYSYHPQSKDQKNPPLLVGYHGSFMNISDEPLKGVVEIPLPVKAKNFKLGFVADYSADLREMFEIEYELNEELGVISWETSREIEPQEMYKFVIEYYTDDITVSGDTKKLDYQFTSFANIGLVNLIFVEPLKTDSFKLDPQAETHQKNTYNMNMFLYQMNDMKAGEEKKVSLEYVRADDRLTLEILEQMAGSTGEVQAATKNEEKIPMWKIMTIVGGVTLVVAIVMIIIIKRRASQPQLETEKTGKSSLDVKRAKLRTMLINGDITEEEYNELLKKLGGEKK